MLNSAILQSSWRKELIIGLDSIALKDGTVYVIEIDSACDIRAINTFNKLYTLRASRKTSLDVLLDNDPDIWSEVQVYGEVQVSGNSKIIFGEGEMGNEGFIAKLDEKNDLVWSLFSTESNPFTESRIKDEEIHIFSSHGFSIVFNLDSNPLDIFIDNHLF